MSYQTIELDNTPRMSLGQVSEISSTQMRMEVDRIYLDLNDIDKINARIKKQLQKYDTLETLERKETRLNLQHNLRHSKELQKRILNVVDENQKMKFQNILSKKVKELEVLSSSLVYKEKELLVKYKDQLEEADLEENNHKYEKKGLLDQSSDDDDSQSRESDQDYEDEENEYFKFDNGSGSNQKSKKNHTQSRDKDLVTDYTINLDDEEEEKEQHQSKQQKQIQAPQQSSSQELDEFQVDSHDDFLRQRTEKIVKVSTSLQKINRMYESLNEIVVSQGEVLTRIGDNFANTRQNTKKTVTELQKALSGEKSIRDRLCGCDFGIMCLTMWFIVAFVFFFLDLMIPTPKIQ